MTPRVRFGKIWVDAVRQPEAIARIEALIDQGRGGVVFTPNLDHVVVADRDESFAQAYGRADLSLCDGQPLRWSSPLLGLALPERVAGADLLVPLLRRAAERRFRVYLLGGGPGVAEAGPARLTSELGVHIVGTDAPMVGLTPRPDEDEVVARVAAAKPDLLVVLLGAPKGELFLDRIRDRVAPAVGIQLGASLDFYLGRVRRAPPWMQRAGLEWLHRLAQEPRRLAHRYLVQDPRFVSILARTLLSPRDQRVRGVS